ncbi:MAG: efflux RND transporter periplasmic adaptor subunit [Thermodesulfobacteriota bacterium]
MKGKKLYVVTVLLLLILTGTVTLMFMEKSVRTNTSGSKTQENEKLIPSVEVTKPVRKDLARKITLSANVEPMIQATLYAKATGYLKWIKADIGDWVKKDEVLAELDVPEMVKEYDQVKANLREAQASYEKAKADYALQKLTYQRTKDTWEEEPGAVAKQDVDIARAKFELAKANINSEKAKIDNAEADMERIKTLLEYGKIKAPFDGVVTKRFLDPGALVQVATSNNVSPVVTIMHTDTVRGFIDVPEPDVPLIKKGNQATLVVDAFSDRTFSGIITRFADALNPETRTMRTEIDIPNPDHILRPGMYGNMTLNLEVHKNAIIILATALVVEKNKKFVYKVMNGKVKKVEIKTGIDDGIQVEVTEGLTGDEDIIVKGKNTVSDGEVVEVVRVSSGS